MLGMFQVSDDGAVQVWRDGSWHQTDASECIEVPGGNLLHLNAEGYWTGAAHGFALGILACMAGIGVVAAVVAERMTQ